MSWSATPRTWVASETVTAALLNTEVRDALTGIGAAWTSYTPTWTAVGTAPSLGNGTLTGAWLQIGKTVHFVIELTAGSTTTFGTNRWMFTLPATEKARMWSAKGVAFDTSATAYYFAQGVRLSSGKLDVFTEPGTAGAAMASCAASSPMTWATGDRLTLNGTVELA